MGIESPARFRVALLIETSNRYGRDLLRGVHEWNQANGRWSIRLVEQARLAKLPSWLDTWSGDGIIARVDSWRASKVLARLGKPVVDVSAERERSEFPKVSIDNNSVARLAFAHLREKRVPNFAFCGDARFLWSRQRGLKFCQLVRESGNTCHVHGARAGASSESEHAQEELRLWLAALPKPVGVFACYDVRAQQVLTACQQLGLAVPNAVAVLGVDNDEVLCEFCDPQLSSILPNARRAGYEAAAILQEMMLNRRRTPASSLVIGPIRVVERQSTDLLGVSDQLVVTAMQFIRAHACDGINVPDVMRATRVSRTLLETKFKRILGYSPHRMIRETRMQRACELLADSDLPIARVADIAGFESATYFSAAFSRQFGRAPLQYRREVDLRTRPS